MNVKLNNFLRRHDKYVQKSKNYVSKNQSENRFLSTENNPKLQRYPIEGSVKYSTDRLKKNPIKTHH